MHVNHRRKNRYKYQGRRWHTALGFWKKAYWDRERARAKQLIAKGRADDCQDKHPKSVLWDAL